jgi:integrase
MIRPEMTWDATTRRWFKRFKPPGAEKHKTFAISAKRLAKIYACPATKTGSVSAANNWWQQKQGELLEVDSIPTSGKAVIKRLEREVAAAARLGDATTASILMRAVVEVQRRLRSGASLPPQDPDTGRFIVPNGSNPQRRLLEELVCVREAAVQALDLKPPKSSELGSVRAAVDEYTAHRLVDVHARLLSRGRYSLLVLALGRFADFVTGELASVNGKTVASYRAHLLSKDYSASHVRDCLSAMKQFLQWAYENEHLEELPKNLRSKSIAIRVPKTEVKTFTVDEVKTLLKHAKQHLRFYLTLLLNIGGTQCDLSGLHQGEYDRDKKTITRKRSKTAQHDNVPVVSYPLWACTASMIEKYKSQDPERLLLGPEGNPLKTERLGEKGEGRRSDYIGRLFSRYVRSLRRRGILDCKLSLKYFRKTGANMIRSKFTKDLSGLYLGHAPRDVQDGSYTRPSQSQFEEAINWLGREFGLVD